jgi:hypothetical protein
MNNAFATFCSLFAQSWYDFFKDFSPSFVATIFGAVAAWIAFNQWKTANNKLKFDLFDKRMEIYNRTREFLAKTVREGNGDFSDSLHFLHSVDSAKFLFDKEISEYMRKIYNQSVQLRSLNDDYKILEGAQKALKIQERGKLFAWFTTQFDELDSKMHKYLAIRI